MAKLRPFEKPIGFRDLLPEVVKKKRMMENQLQELFQSWGYEEILTPTLEYDLTIGTVSAISNSKMFKLQDRLGHTLVLKPDMTAPIARVISSNLKDKALPIRISYHTNVFRAQENEAGRAAELYQSGIELVGEGTPDGDAEVLALAIESLRLLQLGKFKLIVGHTSFLNGMLEESIKNKKDRELLKAYLANKNFVGYQEKVKEIVSSKEEQERLLVLIHLQGDVKVIEMAKEFAHSQAAKNALEDLLQVWRMMKIYGSESFISFDLTLVPHMEYYTGMTFVGMVEGIGFPVCSGGRYDSLFDTFQNPQAAIGFALHMDRILQATKAKLSTKKKIKVIYDNQHQEEALQYVLSRRKENGISIETQRLRNLSNTSMEEDKEMIWFVGGGDNQ